MKRVMAILLTTVIIAILTACSSGGAAPAEPVKEGVAVYDKTQIEILDAEFTDKYKDINDAEGIPAIMVRFHFKNDGTEPLYAFESFGIDAYQDGIELDFISLNDNVHEEAHNVIRGVKDGAELDFMMAFATKSDSPVEVRITEPTAEAKELLTETFEK